MYNSLSEIINLQREYIMDLSENEILDMLFKISRNTWFEGIKLGTEVEGNTFEEISFVRELFPKYPLKFKIGGAGAKNDIRMAFLFKVNTIILPMAESQYAIENFIRTYHEYRDIFGFDIPLSMNLETIEAFNKIDQLQEFFNHFSQITIGRSDLSESMHENVNSKDVMKIVKQIIGKVKEYDPSILLSIGGKITPKAAKNVVTQCRSDLVNTQFVYIQNNKNIEKHVKLALIFEMLLYILFFKKRFRTDFELNRFIDNHYLRLEN